MAYATGTVASPTALKTTIETFCTDNGWTLSGSGYLYKGLSFVKLTASGSTTLQLQAANSSDGVISPYTYVPYIYIDSGNWPVTYYLFVQANPDILICVLQYATNIIQPIIFGDISKIHTSAYIGGNWLYAPKQNITYQANEASLRYISDIAIGGCGYTSLGRSGTVLPFSCSEPFNTINNRNCAFHAEIDSLIWENSPQNSTNYEAGRVSLTDYTISAYFRSPNSWNSQAQLVPIHLQFGASSGFSMYLGYIEHIRFIRIDNYEIGDIITLGSDKWKVFPWNMKDSINRNGAANVSGSGTLGFAVRYDGP